MTAWLYGWWSTVRGPSVLVLNPAHEEEGFEEEWMDSAGQQMVAQLMLATGIRLL